MKSLAIFVAAVGFAVCARGETLVAEPDAFLEYIEATGLQYIDTDINAETGLKAQIDFAWASGDMSGKDWSLLDAAVNNSDSNKRSRFLMCHLYGEGGKPLFGYGLKQRRNPAGSFPFVGGQRCEIITDMTDPDSLELYQYGVKTFSEEDLETFKTNGFVNLHLNLFVFACNLSGYPSWYGQGRLYELNIWKKNDESGELDLVRHYVPCKKGGRAGLYDKVEGKIYYSFSNDNFIPGPAIAPPQGFKDPQGNEIEDPAVIEWLSKNDFTQSDINALGNDTAATDKLYECFLLNCSIKAENPGGALSITGFAVSNGVVSVTVQLVRQSPLGFINGILYLYGADDLASGFSLISEEIVGFGADDDPMFDIDQDTDIDSGTGLSTQTVTATYDTFFGGEKFFKAAIGFPIPEEPDEPWDEPEPEEPDEGEPDE